MENRFWEFVEKIDWQRYINDRKKLQTRYNKDEIILSIAPYFTWEEYVEFEKIYRKHYNLMYKKFHDVWLSDEYNGIMPSDDGYTDLISSIVGKGYQFYSNVDDESFVKMARKHDYMENFGYLFQNANGDINFKLKYDEIRKVVVRDTKIDTILN